MDNSTTLYSRSFDFILELEEEFGSDWARNLERLKQAFVTFALKEKALPSPIVPEVVEWEYCEMTSYWVENEMGRLNWMGKEGWGLCATTSSHSGTSTYIFKRQKQKP